MRVNSPLSIAIALCALSACVLGIGVLLQELVWRSWSWRVVVAHGLLLNNAVWAAASMIAWISLRPQERGPYDRTARRTREIGDFSHWLPIFWWCFWGMAFLALAGLAFTSRLGRIQLFAALVLLGVWLLDLVLALPWARIREEDMPLFRDANSKYWTPWQRTVRGVLHLVVCIVAWVATLRSGTLLFSTIGIAMPLGIGIAFAMRVLLQPFDAHSLSGMLFLRVYRWINRWVPWYQLPKWLAVLNLAALREDLRKFNLSNTASIPVTEKSGMAPEIPIKSPLDDVIRNPLGLYNDPEDPHMGRASHIPVEECNSTLFTHSHPGARFGRNVPLECISKQNVLEPNPRVVSQLLMARKTFQPAMSINLLAAAWIQFEVHDWFSHGEPVPKNPIEVPIPDGDGWGKCPMSIRRTRPDPTRSPSDQHPPTFVSSESHAWDASQIYATHPLAAESLRDDSSGPGYLKLDGKRTLGIDNSGNAQTGFRENWWVGLSMLHSLFAQEHNAVCDALAREYPRMSPEEVFQKARLIVSALVAKIHTIEWTPAILNNPVLDVAMNANWYGLFTKRFVDAFGRLGFNEAFWGIPGSGIDHHAAPYALTEEFAAVYRLHPLMPDKFEVYQAVDGALRETFVLPKGVVGTEKELRDGAMRYSQEDLFYSFGINHPGQLVLHNYPNFLRELKQPDGETIDLATVDIVRDRERGVPRYNAFRRALRLKPIGSFDDFGNPEIGSKLRAVYNANLGSGPDQVEDLDLQIGMWCEAKPPGFAISDTAFRIFILMASRRLKSDRFIAQDFTSATYTPLGMQWVNDNNMREVILRHYPSLAPQLYQIDNAFKPWRSVKV